jgi:pyruvate kinase
LVPGRIAERIERSGGANYQEKAPLTTPRQKLVKSAVIMANELRADAILVFTYGGHMARHAAWMRPRHSPIYVACENEAVAHALTLSWGIVPRIVSFDHIQPENTITAALTQLQAEGLLRKGQHRGRGGCRFHRHRDH